MYKSIFQVIFSVLFSNKKISNKFVYKYKVYKYHKLKKFIKFNTLIVYNFLSFSIHFFYDTSLCLRY